MIKPDWQSDDGAVTLYCGDCLKILPQLEAGSVDAVVTDPPYLNLKGGYERVDDRLGKRKSASVAIGDPWKASMGWASEAIRVSKYGAIVFCGYQSIVDTAVAFDSLRRAVFLTWHKTNSPPTGKNVPRFTEEYAWGFAKRAGLKWDGFKETMIRVPSLAVGCCCNKERVLGADGKAAHPTQKPTAVFNWIIDAIDPLSVLDPFMGSGTTGVACVKTGRRFVGIELDRGYFNIAVKRVEKAIAEKKERLFAEATA